MVMGGGTAHWFGPGRVTGKQEVIGIGEFLTPLDPKLRISSG
jgi:hypothetical protein